MRFTCTVLAQASVHLSEDVVNSEEGDISETHQQTHSGCASDGQEKEG